MIICQKVEHEDYNELIFKYKEKGEKMKIYHVETQQAHDELMIELEEKGYKWLSGHNPTSKNYWSEDKEDACFAISGKNITFDSIEWYKNEYPDISIIEYKAKGDSMTQEEMKQDIIDWATDVSVAVEAAIKDIKFQMKKSTVEADLKEAKSSAKKLVEKIDEYLESQKPEFKVGDYVVDDSSFLTMKVDGSSNSLVDSAICYNFRYFTVRNNFVCEAGYLRHATPSEIEEYKVAMTFHKHGRNPFELKKGDLIRTPSGSLTLISNPENYTKEDFLVYGWELLKTAEEVNEWLGADEY